MKYKKIFKDIYIVNKPLYIYFGNKKSVRKIYHTVYADTTPRSNKIRIVDWFNGIPTYILIHEILHNSLIEQIYENNKELQKEWKSIVKIEKLRKNKLLNVKDYDEVLINFLSIYLIYRDLRLLPELRKKYPRACNFVTKLIRLQGKIMAGSFSVKSFK